MARQSVLRLANIAPVSPKSQAMTPSPRMTSMTEVVQPEQSMTWDAATGAIQGGKVNASTLTAGGRAAGYPNPGFIARGQTLLMPGSSDDWT